MGLPGSETSLEELMCHLLGELLQAGVVAKLADDIHIGADDPRALLETWTMVLSILKKCNLGLSPAKTYICPVNTTILGW